MEGGQGLKECLCVSYCVVGLAIAAPVLARQPSDFNHAILDRLTRLIYRRRCLLFLALSRLPHPYGSIEPVVVVGITHFTLHLESLFT